MEPAFSSNDITLFYRYLDKATHYFEYWWLDISSVYSVEYTINYIGRERLYMA